MDKHIQLKLPSSRTRQSFKSVQVRIPLASDVAAMGVRYVLYIWSSCRFIIFVFFNMTKTVIFQSSSKEATTMVTAGSGLGRAS